MKKYAIERLLELINFPAATCRIDENNNLLIFDNTDDVRTHFSDFIDSDISKIIEIELNHHDVCCSIAHFHKYFNQREDSFYLLAKDISDNKYIYLHLDPLGSLDDIQEGSVFFDAINHLHYLKIIKLISGIANYTDWGNRKIILTSSDKGTLVLLHKRYEDLYFSVAAPNLIRVYLDLSDLLTHKGMKEIFISNIFEKLISLDDDSRFAILLSNFLEIKRSVEQNYEIYLKEFSFEKLNTDFRTAKSKYFSGTRDLISRLTMQIASVPIVISVATLATFKLDNTVGLLIIGGVYFLYTIYLSRIFSILKIEIDSINADFEDDTSSIGMSLTTISFEHQFSEISKRISKVRTTLNFCKWINWIFFLILSVFLAAQAWHVMPQKIEAIFT